MRYFFIGGAPKSGTTWLQRSLDLHPHVVCSGEGHLHQFIVRPIHEMLEAYNGKLAVVAEAVYEGRPYYPLVLRKDQIEITAAVMSLLMGRRTKPGARLIGDKTPANASVVEDLAVLFPEMKFIAMLRDPRDVASSRLGHARRNGMPEVDDRSSEGYRGIVKAAAIDCRVAFEQTQKFAAKRPAQSLEVKYEALTRDPQGELARVFDFLSVETSPGQLADIVNASSFEAFSGGRKAGEESHTSFYRKGVVGDWPKDLTDEAVQILSSECGAAARLAGYEI